MSLTQGLISHEIYLIKPFIVYMGCVRLTWYCGKMADAIFFLVADFL